MYKYVCTNYNMNVHVIYRDSLTDIVGISANTFSKSASDTPPDDDDEEEEEAELDIATRPMLLEGRGGHGWPRRNSAQLNEMSQTFSHFLMS